MIRRLLIPLTAVLVLGACSQPDPPPTVPTEKPTYQPIPPVTEQPTYSSTGGLPPTTAPASVDPSPTAFVTPTVDFPAPAEGETPEERAVRDAFEEYHLVLDTYMINPHVSDLAEAERVTVPGSRERQALGEIVEFIRGSGLYRSGVIEFRDVKIELRDPGEATVSYCQDGSATRTYHVGSAEPTLPPNPTILEAMDLEKGEGGVWRVSKVEGEAVAC